MASSSSSRSRHTKSTVPTTASSKTRRSSAYDKDFEQHYIDHRVYPKGYDYRDRCPTPEPGLEGLYQRLPQPRPSLSPSHFPDSDFRDFKRKNARVISKGKVMSTVFPIISGDADIPNEENLQFTRLESMTGSVTVDPRPDFYDGARLEDIDRVVREELGPYIIPTGHTTAPVAPNFFMEAKAPSGGADVARRQAMQDGACGARAMHSLQSYSEGKPVYDGNAYTVTSTYHAGTGTLKLYATHPTVGPENSPEYHMTQIKGWDLTSDQHMTYSGWLAALDTGDVSAPTVEEGSYPPGVDQVNDSQYYPSQPQVLSAYEERSTFKSPHDDRFSNEPIQLVSNENGGCTSSPSTESPKYDSHPDMYPTQESDSAGELALDASLAIPTTERKRKHKLLQSENAPKSRSKTHHSRIDAAKSPSNDSASSSRERRWSKRGKVDSSSSSVGNWVWDEQRKENMAWDKGLERWVYWDEDCKAEKYLDDDNEWQWV
ncbi:hypothetical protein EG329_006730 [Mollisiaceae sp. DMI_Dod_QoI]|nr:hypothetical protein EG329_006730 [Helotiales sp. DMI_Dod_QoI]